MTFMCTPIAGQALVRLTFDFTVEAGTQTDLVLSRSIDGGPFEILLDYGLLCEEGVYYDQFMPLDTPITYQVVVSPGNITQTCSVTVPSEGYVWFKDPGRPFANLPVDLCLEPTPPAGTDCAPLVNAVSLIQFGEETRASDANLFPVLDREHPIDVFARRKGVVTSVQFASRSCEAIDAVYNLFTAGGPIFIQAPPVYCWPDRFLQPGDLSMSYISRDQRKPWRLWDVPLTALDPQAVINIQGTVCANWCGIKDTYATFADLTATGLTWLEVAQGEALC